MKRVLCYGCLLFCSAGSLGCIDTAQNMLRDGITTQNELCDIMMRASDEESAKLLAKAKLEPLKRKWDSIVERGKTLQDITPEQAIEALDYELRFLDEIAEVSLRIQDEIERLKEIRFQLVLEEYVKRRDEGFTPRFIDKETYNTLVTRSNLFGGMIQVGSAGALHLELLKAKGSRANNDEVEMLILDKGNELGTGRPTVIFVDVNAFNAFYTSNGRAPWAPVFTTRPFISKEAVGKLADEGKLSDEAAFHRLYDPLERRQPFIDAGLAEAPYMKKNLNTNAQGKLVINGGSMFSGLTQLIMAPGLYDLKTIWQENPLTQTLYVDIPGLLTPTPPKKGGP